MNSFTIEKQVSSNNSIESTKLIHICSQCTRTFKDINNFREHLFQEHGKLGINIRQCHLCSYATLLKSKYDCHLRCHLNNRIIRCRKCNYSTINIRHMSKHERQHNLSHVVNIRISKVKHARIDINKDKSNRIPCSHEHNLNSLRTNISTLLQMLLPQLSLYYQSNNSIDQLIENLIKIPFFYRPYSSI